MAYIDSLSDDIQHLRSARPRTFAQWLEQAEPEDKQLVMDAITDTAIPSNALAVLLTKKHNIPITRETIEGYRVSR